MRPKPSPLAAALSAALLGCGALTLGLAGSAVGAASAPRHAPISITSDADFSTCGCVVSGGGSPSNPYVIGPWSINNANGAAVTIDGSGGNLTKSFDLHNLVIAGNSTPYSDGIVIRHVNQSSSVSGNQTSIQTVGTGILVEDSSNVALDGGGASINGPGVTTSAGVINKDTTGAIDVENSNHIMIHGWRMNADGADGAPDFLGFSPSISDWFVGGVRFFGVDSSTVDHNAANNDTSVSYSLFKSTHDTISNNTANYPYTTNVLITDGSHDNQIIENALATGDFFGILVADPLPGHAPQGYAGPSYRNLIEGNTDHSDGPTGTEKAAGQAPSFVGGIVVLNGSPDNTIQDNTAWAQAGGALVWAQAIPASTPIGVATDPPIIHCNVALSDGGSSLTNQNGNVWIGNSVQAQDPCIPPQ